MVRSWPISVAVRPLAARSSRRAPPPSTAPCASSSSNADSRREQASNATRPIFHRLQLHLRHQQSRSSGSHAVRLLASASREPRRPPPRLRPQQPVAPPFQPDPTLPASRSVAVRRPGANDPSTDELASITAHRGPATIQPSDLMPLPYHPSRP
ncbi:hypothetical protein ACLOJK_029807 [Asimina triloba]